MAFQSAFTFSTTGNGYIKSTFQFSETVFRTIQSHVLSTILSEPVIQLRGTHLANSCIINENTLALCDEIGNLHCLEFQLKDPNGLTETLDHIKPLIKRRPFPSLFNINHHSPIDTKHSLHRLIESPTHLYAGCSNGELLEIDKESFKITHKWILTNEPITALYYRDSMLYVGNFNGEYWGIDLNTRNYCHYLKMNDAPIYSIGYANSQNNAVTGAPANLIVVPIVGTDTVFNTPIVGADKQPYGSKNQGTLYETLFGEYMPHLLHRLFLNIDGQILNGQHDIDDYNRDAQIKRFHSKEQRQNKQGRLFKGIGFFETENGDWVLDRFELIEQIVRDTQNIMISYKYFFTKHHGYRVWLNPLNESLDELKFNCSSILNGAYSHTPKLKPFFLEKELQEHLKQRALETF